MPPGESAAAAPERTASGAAGRPVVAVFGSAAFAPESPACRIASALGGGIARCGWVLACGGYGGAMEAASRGAAEAGGRTIGVTCETLSRAGRRTNRWIREEIRLPTARERLLTLCRMGDAAVALDGGIGTLAEIAFFASQIQTGELSPRPLVLLGTVWQDSLPAFFRSAGKYLTGADRSLFTFCPSVDTAVAAIRRHLAPS